MIVALPHKSVNLLYYEIEEGPGKPMPLLSEPKSTFGTPKRTTLMKRFKGKLSGESGSDNATQSDNTVEKGAANKVLDAVTNGLQLRLVERNKEVAPNPPRVSHESPHDNAAFALRRVVEDDDDAKSDKFQVISVSTFSEIRIMTLEQPFIGGLFERPIAGLAKVKDSHDSEFAELEGITSPSKIRDQNKKMTANEQKLKEIEAFRSTTPYVTNVRLS